MRSANPMLKWLSASGQREVDSAVGDLAVVADLDDDGGEINDGIERIEGGFELVLAISRDADG
jgi:hypothetical protein